MVKKILIGSVASLCLVFLVGHFFGDKIVEFYSFNKTVNSLLERASAVKHDERNIINLTYIEGFQSFSDGFVGLIINGEEYHVQKTRSMVDFHKIAGSDKAYLYREDNVNAEYRGLAALCFFDEDEKRKCLLAVNIKTI